MKLIMIILFVIIFSTTSIAKNLNIAIITTDEYKLVPECIKLDINQKYEIITYFFKKLDSNFNLENYDIIIFVGDNIVPLINKLNIDHSKTKSIYCCNFYDHFEYIQLDGVKYKINFKQIIDILGDFNNIYILTDSTNNSKLEFLKQNLTEVHFQIESIKTLYQLRSFFLDIKPNSIFFNSITSIQNFDKNFINSEILKWKKSSIDISFLYDATIIFKPDCELLNINLSNIILNENYDKNITIFPYIKITKYTRDFYLKYYTNFNFIINYE